MNIFSRLQIAWLAFKDHTGYTTGANFRQSIRRLHMGRIVVVRYDSEMEYRFDEISSGESYVVCHYLGLPL